MRKKKSTHNSPIRKITLSLTWKITLIVVVILIFTVAIISTFVIDHQNEILDQQLEDTMDVYLETFRMNIIEKVFEDQGDVIGLSEYINSYTNIESFLYAVYADNYDNIIAPDIFTNISFIEKSKDLFERGYYNKVFLEYIDITNTNIYPKTISNKTKSVITNVELNQTNYIPKIAVFTVTNTNVTEGVTNFAMVMITNVPIHQYINGYTPVYITDYFSSDMHRDWTRLQFYHQLWLNGDLYQEDLRQAVTNELLHNLEFVEYFYLYYYNVFYEDNTLTDLGKRLQKGFLDNTEENSNYIVEHDITVLGYYEAKDQIIIDSLFNKANQKYLTEIKDWIDFYVEGNEFPIMAPAMESILSILGFAGLSSTKVEYFTRLKNEGRLFSNTNLMPNWLEEEHIRNIGFTFFLDYFIGNYYDENYGAKQTLYGILKQAYDLNPEGVALTNYYVDKIEYLDKINRSRFQPYQLQNLSLNKAQGEGLYGEDLIGKVFQNMYNIFRNGTGSIMIDYSGLEKQRKGVINDTVDIAIVFILRIIVITFLIVVFMIAPLNVLGLESDQIAIRLDNVDIDDPQKFNKGLDELTTYLDKTIRIKSRDELGQLADKFNIMTHKFKLTFDAIKDKFRMGAELETAREIQSAILPKVYPEFEGFQFSHYYEPQSESGGDYYDFIEVDKKRFGIVIADVTNHGVGAAMVMAILRSNMRTLASGTIDAGKVLRQLNPIIYRDTLPTMYATMFYGVVDSENKTMHYSVAGHEKAILINLETRKIGLLPKGGIAVGVLDSDRFDNLIKLHKITLKSGDIFIQYTDGIVEAVSVSGERYGDERFHKAIAKYAGDDLDKMREGLIDDLKKFTAGAEQSDDITLLLMKVV